MPGKANSSPFGRAVGVLVAALAVVLLVLDRFTGVDVPYGYDGGSTLLFVVGAVVAAGVVLALGWRYRNELAE